MSIKFSCVTLRHMSFSAGVVISISFQEINNTPDSQSSADGCYQGLQDRNTTAKKLHNVLVAKIAFPFLF